jgi:ABC-type Mn2+/Zn2+ transport system ATPase subunit
MDPVSEYIGPRIRSVALDGWPNTFASCALELSPRRTVLVGRNGAGKSLLMDGLYRAARHSVSRIPRRALSNSLEKALFEVTLPNDVRQLFFEYSLTRFPMTPEEIVEAEGVGRFECTEKCWFLPEAPLWEVKGGAVTFADGKTFPVPPGLGLLAFDVSDRPREAEALVRLFRGIRRVAPGFPRHAGKEIEIAQRIGERIRPSARHQRSRISDLSDQLVAAFDSKKETFDEFTELMRKVGVSTVTEVTTLKAGKGADSEFAMVDFDGCNIGQLSDGTLRVAEILWTLITLRPGDLLLFEEPEIGIHPGLLRRLLAVVDSYTLDHQVVLSTHSLQVVNWAAPNEIRLVHREAGYDSRTVARALTSEQLARLEPYLNDEGSLGDFIYSGGADD